MMSPLIGSSDFKEKGKSYCKKTLRTYLDLGQADSDLALALE